MAENDVLAVFRADISDMQKNIENLKKEVRGYGKTVDDTNRGVSLSFQKAQNELSGLNKLYTELKFNGRENGVVARGIAKDIDALTQKLSVLDRANKKIVETGGRLKSSFNGLGNSINQLTRELPAFTYSAQTGFLALSNNIPVLGDQIQMLKVKNQELVASGEKAIPIWKSLTSALFSWQTLLSVGVTVLTLYGGKLFDFIGSLFETEKQLNKVKDAQKALNDIQREASIGSTKEILNVRLLRDNIEAQYASQQRRLDAINKLRETYPKIFKNYTDEALLTGNATEAYNKLEKAIKAKNAVSEASGKIDTLKKYEISLLERQKEIDKENLDILRKEIDLEDKMKVVSGGRFGINKAIKEQNDLTKRKNDLNKESVSIEQKLEDLRSKILKIQGEASSDLALSLELEKENQSKEEKALTEREKILKRISDLEVKIQNAIILKGKANNKDVDSLQDQLNLLHQIDEEYERIMLTISDVSKLDFIRPKDGLESFKKAQEDKTKVHADELKKQNDAFNDSQEKQRELLKQQKEHFIQTLASSATSLSNSYLDISNNFVQSQINGITTAKDANIQQLDSLLEHGKISQEKYDKDKLALEIKSDNEIKRLKLKQFEREKLVNTGQAIMNGILAVQKAYAELGPFGIPAAIALGAVTAANVVAIQTQPIPQFEKGGHIKGKRHREGGVLIEAEGGEFINNRISTQKYKEELESANNLSLEKLIYRKHVIPALRKEREKISNALASNFNDVNLLMSDRETRQILRDIRDGVKSNSKYSTSLRFRHV